MWIWFKDLEELHEKKDRRRMGYSKGLCHDTLHYWLRCPIGFLNPQRKSKSRRLFLTQGTPKTDNFALFVKIMTQILRPAIVKRERENTWKGQSQWCCLKMSSLSFADQVLQHQMSNFERFIIFQNQNGIGSTIHLLQNQFLIIMG